MQKYSSRVVGFSGVRKLGRVQTATVKQSLNAYFQAKQWVMGDARGVDSLVLAVAEIEKIEYKQFCVEHNRGPWSFSDRSIRMVDYLESVNGILVAFPNKPCPSCCVPRIYPSGGGSGTWLTIAAARHRGLEIEIHPIAKGIDLPQWLTHTQLRLF